jgi:hypothetical protein
MTRINLPHSHVSHSQTCFVEWVCKVVCKYLRCMLYLNDYLSVSSFHIFSLNSFSPVTRRYAFQPRWMSQTTCYTFKSFFVFIPFIMMILHAIYCCRELMTCENAESEKVLSELFQRQNDKRKSYVEVYLCVSNYNLHFKQEKGEKSLCCV